MFLKKKKKKNKRNVPTKYQLPTPYNFQDVSWTNVDGHYDKSQIINQGHTMKLHTYTPDHCPYLVSSFHIFQDTAQNKILQVRSLHQGQRSNHGHTMMLHTYTLYPMSLQSINLLHLIVSKI